MLRIAVKVGWPPGWLIGFCVARRPPGGALGSSLGALSVTRASKGCPDDHGAVDHQPDSACALGFCRIRTVIEGQELLISLLEPINDSQRPLRLLCLQDV